MSTEIHSRLRNVVSAIEPTRGEKIELSPDEVRFQSLLLVMQNETVSYREAVKIVGGKIRLERLMTAGSIRAFKPEGHYTRNWRINAVDCYMNVKPRLKDVLKKRNENKYAV